MTRPTWGKSVNYRKLKCNLYLTKVHLKYNYLNYVDPPLSKFSSQSVKRPSQTLLSVKSTFYLKHQAYFDRNVYIYIYIYIYTYIENKSFLRSMFFTTSKTVFASWSLWILNLFYPKRTAFIGPIIMSQGSSTPWSGTSVLVYLTKLPLIQVWL